jgi:hypothetical protein
MALTFDEVTVIHGEFIEEYSLKGPLSDYINLVGIGGAPQGGLAIIVWVSGDLPASLNIPSTYKGVLVIIEAGEKIDPH